MPERKLERTSEFTLTDAETLPDGSFRITLTSAPRDLEFTLSQAQKHWLLYKINSGLTPEKQKEK